MARRRLSPKFYLIFCLIYCIGGVVLAAPWDNDNSEYGERNECGQSNSFDNGRSFMNYGCAGQGGNTQQQPYSSQASSYHHINSNNPHSFNHNLLKNLPPGSNTTLIPLGQVLIPTGKEVSLCTNQQNTQNRNMNTNNGMGSGMFGNSGASGYGSNMGSGYGDNSNCCQGYGNMYGQFGQSQNQGYGNYMGNSGFMGGSQGQSNNYGFGSSGYPTPDYSNANGCGGSPMDGCCPCSKKRRRRFVGQLFSRLTNKRFYHSKPTNNLHFKNLKKLMY